MFYDNKILLDLQDKYIHNKDAYIDEYFLILKEIATYQIVFLLGKSGYGTTNYPQDRIEEIAVDSVLRFLKMYNKPFWKWNGNISNRLIMDVRDQMYGYKAIRIDKELSIDDHTNEAFYGPHEITDDPILELDNVDLYHLAASTYYKRAILAIAAIKGKEYCYNKAKELRYVFLILKNGKEKNEKKENKNLRNSRRRPSKQNK